MPVEIATARTAVLPARCPHCGKWPVLECVDSDEHWRAFCGEIRCENRTLIEHPERSGAVCNWNLAARRW